MLLTRKQYNVSRNVLVLIILFLNLQLPAQNNNTTATRFPEPIFEHLTINDGLPENSVLCILQDHLGYLWLGTLSGLVKYDGYNMIVYQSNPSDSLSISHQAIRTIYEDRSGTLWIGTGGSELGGLNKFDRTSETFTSYLHNPDDSTSINSNLIISMYEDNRGNFWVSTSEGLNLFDRQKEIFSHIYYQDSVYSPAVYEYLLSLTANRNTISSILHVGDNADISKTFTINKKTNVIVIIMNEAAYDYGWLENANGDIIAGQKNNNVVCAGGHINNQIQIVIDSLNRGKYRLRFVSDGAWSYNSWRDAPPDYPDYWGIQVIELAEDQGNIEAILENKISAILNHTVRAYMEDRLTANLYVGSGNKISIFDEEKKIFTEKYANVDLKYDMGEILSFYQSNDRSIWIGHSNGLSKFNSQLNSIKLYQPISSAIYIPENDFSHLIEDHTGSIWTTSFNVGLVSFNPQNELFQIYRHEPDNPNSISSNQVLSLYKDRTGIMWVGTGWAGLNKWDINSQKFKRFSYDPNNPDGKRFNKVFKIVEDSEGLIWFGTEDGLYSFNRFSNEFRNYKYDTKDKSNPVNHIYRDESGIIWLGTEARGLVKFDAVRSSYHFYSNDPNDSTTISHNNVRFILPDENDILWIGTWGGGLNRFDKKTGTFTRYTYDANNPQSLSHDQVSCIYFDRAGKLWIGTDEGGLNNFNRTEETFKSYDLSQVISITTIYEDRQGNLWTGTYGEGIHLFDRDNGISIYNITKKNGLSDNHVRAIMEDNSGNLWISTVNGLSRFNPQTHNIKNYLTSDHFEGNNYWRNSAFKTLAGEMLFGTSDGFIIFHPDSIKDDPTPPQVVISNVSLFNRPGEKLTFDGFISELNELELSYNENDLRFDYVGLHFGEPEKNKYKYIMENFDDDWVDAGIQRNATYTNLDAGEYVFRVRASNRDGVWNEEGASLKIIIPPPFWATWWAYLLYVVFTLGLLYSIRRYELNRTQLKNQHKLDEVKLQEREETDRLKSRFFANISHEFRTPLTLILGPAEKINPDSSGEEIEKQTSVIKRNANRLLGLINQLLDLSKLEAGKLELKTSKANIASFIKGITMSFESLAERKDITLKVKSSNDEIEVYFDKEKMTKIMTNLLSNAFKFTQYGGQITVTIIDSEANMVKIEVRDTGVGIADEEMPKLFDRFYQVDSSQTREHEGTGIGLALTKELIELHHGTISVDSKLEDPDEVGTGWTEFAFELSLGRRHLKDAEIVNHPETEESKDVILSFAESEAKNLLIEELIIDGKDSSLQKDGQASQAPQNDSEVYEEKTLILIVEDNADVREFIKDSLGVDYQIEEASNGEQGVRKAEKIIPDLILSDIMMPKMDGNELTRILKNDELTSHIPIILLTAKSEQESKLEGLETGADDYLTKPFDTNELQIRIKNLINIRKKLQEKYSKGDYVPVKREEEKKLSNLEEQFMSKVMEVIEGHISEEEFSIEQFGKEMGMSRMQLHRKLKALSGKSASNYLRSVRLSKAMKMITEEKGNISEIAYSVGFSSPAYFTRCFKEEYGFPPSDLAS